MKCDKKKKKNLIWISSRYRVQTILSSAVLAAVPRTGVVIPFPEFTLQPRCLPGTASAFGKPGPSESAMGESQRPESSFKAAQVWTELTVSAATTEHRCASNKALPVRAPGCELRGQSLAASG